MARISLERLIWQDLGKKPDKGSLDVLIFSSEFPEGEHADEAMAKKGFTRNCLMEEAVHAAVHFTGLSARKSGVADRSEWKRYRSSGGLFEVMAGQCSCETGRRISTQSEVVLSEAAAIGCSRIGAFDFDRRRNELSEKQEFAGDHSQAASIST